MQKNLIFLCVLFVFGLIILSNVSPSAQPVPSRDSGVFLYVGKGILQGGIPYKDFWDHKGPLIYYINALGLLLIKTSYWGVWLLEVISLIISSYLCFLILKKVVGSQAAFWGTAIWIAGLNIVLDGGNMVEQYALPFQLAQIYLFLFYSQKSSRTLRVHFLIGTLAGFSFLLRPNIIGIVVSISILNVLNLFSFKEKKRDIILNLFATLAGMLIAFLVIYSYFAIMKSAGAFIDSAFIYNFIYSSAENNFWNSLRLGICYLPILFTLSIVAWLVGLIKIFIKKELAENLFFYKLLIIALPVEIIFSLISGRGYQHYFISWLPIMGLLSGYFASDLSFVLDALQKKFTWISGQVWIYILLMGICFLPLVRSMNSSHFLVGDFVKHRGFPDAIYDRFPYPRQIQILQDITSSNEYLLFWGNEMEYNFILNRKAPSHFIYIEPLFTPSYTTSAMVSEFLADIKKHKPVIVIDTAVVGVPSFQFKDQWMQSPAMLSVFQYINENYKISYSIHQLVVYQPVK